MLAHKPDALFIQSQEARCDAVRRFLTCVKPSLTVRVAPIDDGFGPSIEEPDFEAIIVSSETLKGGMAVNSKRQERGMKPLRLLVINRFETHSMSSTFIRRQQQLHSGTPSAPNSADMGDVKGDEAEEVKSGSGEGKVGGSEHADGR